MPNNIRTIHDLKVAKKPLCLFSGGLDSAYLLTLLDRKARESCVALTVDLGGDWSGKFRDDFLFSRVKDITNKLEVHSVVVNSVDQFISSYVMPAIPAQCRYLGGHPLSASLSRPLISKIAVETAIKFGCDSIIHTSTPSQNSMRRFNGSIQDLGYTGIYGSPYEKTSIAREEKIKTLRKRGIDGFELREFSFDSNIWGSEIESGKWDNPEIFNSKEVMNLNFITREVLSDKYIKIRFESGLPTTLNDKEISLKDMLLELNSLGEKYAVGTYVELEEIGGGVKVQEIHNMPGATIILDAFRYLESGCISSEVIRIKMTQEQLWVREAVEGRWYSLLKSSSDAFIQTVAKNVSGTVQIQLIPGLVRPVGLKSDIPLYITSRDEYESKLL